MNRLSGLLAGIFLSWSSVGIAAPAPRCDDFTGTLILTPTTCQAFKDARERENIFRDTVFLFELLDPIPPGICFTGTIDGALAGQSVMADSLSAVTLSKFYDPDATVPPPIFMAASIVTVSSTKDHGKKDKVLGSIFLRDTGVVDAYFNATEQLIGVGGTTKFKNVSVSMEIQGNEIGGAPVRGKICQ